jgi:hypothetical protein
MRQYFTLAVRNLCDNKWSPEFGDYSRSVVKSELEDFRRNYSASRLKILATTDNQEDITAAIVALNASEVK